MAPDLSVNIPRRVIRKVKQDELLAAANSMLAKIGRLASAAEADGDDIRPVGAKAEVSEFLRTYAGAKSSFYLEAKEAVGYPARQLRNLEAILRSFTEYVEAGLHAELSPQRRAQLDVVSDLLEQAHRLLETSGVHPAAPAMLIGATLEEYLRTWVETSSLSIGAKKPGIQAYADALREAELITKQDMKDITSWAGIRNHAAHGEWEQVSDKQRITLMLEGVNLFMRRYGA